VAWPCLGRGRGRARHRWQWRAAARRAARKGARPGDPKKTPDSLSVQTRPRDLTSAAARATGCRSLANASGSTRERRHRQWRAAARRPKDESPGFTHKADPGANSRSSASLTTTATPGYNPRDDGARQRYTGVAAAGLPGRESAPRCALGREPCRRCSRNERARARRTPLFLLLRLLRRERRRTSVSAPLRISAAAARTAATAAAGGGTTSSAVGSRCGAAPRRPSGCGAAPRRPKRIHRLHLLLVTPGFSPP